MSDPHCPKCLNTLDVAGGIPATCPCNWRKPRSQAKAKAVKAKPAVMGLHRRFGGKCRYCGLPLKNRRSAKDPDTITKDQFIPKLHGGGNGAHNEVLACRSCNTAKGGFNPRLMLWVWHEIDPDGMKEAYEALVR